MCAFLSIFIMTMMSIMVPYVCPVFSMWFEYSELLLLFLMTCTCSLYLVLNVLPVCFVYFNGQSRHFSW
jgi:hypothetical protein